MNEPYHTALRHLRRKAGLTQDDIARILGKGGRSYVAMLESGDRVPHVRDVLLLALLFGHEEAEVFPQLYSSTREIFQSNIQAVIKAALAEGERSDSERVRFLREALTTVTLSENIDPDFA